MRSIFRKSVVAACTILSVLCSGALGDTNYWAPRGSPETDAGMMKTLEQVEPRIIITNLPFSITTPGSYYIVQSLPAASSNYGITIASSDVKIDLNGFALNGNTQALDAICIPSGQYENISIRNGIIRNWGGFGINATNASDVVVMEMKLFGNGYGGIYAGPNSYIERCSAYGNGFLAPKVNPPLDDAIQVYSFSTIKDCKIRANGGAGIHSYDHSRVIGCTSVMNTNADGVHLENFCTIKDCTVSQNRNGLSVGNYSRVSENTVGFNGWTTSSGVGINVASYDVIERNIVCNNKIGISVGGTGSLVINNYISKSGPSGVGGLNDIAGAINTNYIGAATSFTNNCGEFNINNPWMNFKFGGSQ